MDAHIPDNTSHLIPFNPIEQKALALLSSGVTPEQCASALGVTASRVSQMISTELFAGRLAELKFESLRKHNARDDELDALEDTIIAQLKGSMSLVYDPMKLARLLTVVNSAKRRGASAPEQVLQKQTILKLNIPLTLIQRFTVSTNNQVISAGGQDLVTIQSHQMKSLAAQIAERVDSNVGTEGPSDAHDISSDTSLAISVEIPADSHTGESSTQSLP